MEEAGDMETSSCCMSSSSRSSSSSCCSMRGLGEDESICPSAAAAGRGDGTQLSPWLASPWSLYLIRLRLLRESHFTLSPEELLALFQLAAARREALLKPLETLSPFISPSNALALPQHATGKRGMEAGGPQAQLAAERLQPHSRGWQSVRFDPLDVCLLLLSGELSWSDLPLLEALEETAAAAEAATQQRESHWWGWWPSLLLGLKRRRRGDVWREAAARLQGRGGPCAASSPLSLGLRKKSSTPREAGGGGPSTPLLPSAAGVGTADLLGLGEETGVGAFAVSSLTTAASSRGSRLNQRSSSAPTAIPAAAAGGDRGLVGSRSPGGDRSSQLRDGSTAWNRSLEETAGEGGEAVFKAAAATVSRMGNEALALLPHGCQWPWAASSRAPAAAVSGLSSASMTSSSCLFQGAPQHPTIPGWGPPEGPPGGLNAANGCGEGGAPHAAEPPLGAAETWRASVGLRLRRESRPGGRRRREARGLRQKLSPLDPPYDAYALYLHPFSCVGATELPDAEAARAAEVNEVCLDFLGRSRGADSCSSCGQPFAVSGDPSKGNYSETQKRKPCCLNHHRLHYTKVGEGREKVVLIHGICMSGYFFADLIRFLVPDSPSQGEDDPHESWRFTVYCVDLLGYGKSSSVPSSHSYSRPTILTALPQLELLLLRFCRSCCSWCHDATCASAADDAACASFAAVDTIFSLLLVGHSFGGLVAAELCEMLPPGFVTTLILLAPAYFESERQAVRILTALHFPASHTIAHPYFGEFLLRLGVVLRPLFEPLVLSIVPKGELPQLSVADVFCIHPDALTGTIRSIGNQQQQQQQQQPQQQQQQQQQKRQWERVEGREGCEMVCVTCSALLAPQAAGAALCWQQQQQQQQTWVMCMRCLWCDSTVQDRVDRTFQLLRQRGQRASLFHGTKDGVIPIRQARQAAPHKKSPLPCLSQEHLCRSSTSSSSSRSTATSFLFCLQISRSALPQHSRACLVGLRASFSRLPRAVYGAHNKAGGCER
ncbi:hypothetical protein Emed_000147 [Eimeria media]